MALQNASKFVKHPLNAKRVFFKTLDKPKLVLCIFVGHLFWPSYVIFVELVVTPTAKVFDLSSLGIVLASLKRCLVASFVGFGNVLGRQPRGVGLGL